jgi:hypothetical protein
MADKRNSESEIESECGTNSKDATSVKKNHKRKYKTRYSKEWEVKFPFVKPCRGHISDKEYKFFCSICNINLSCSQGGINDVTVHSGKTKFNFNLVLMIALNGARSQCQMAVSLFKF